MTYHFESRAGYLKSDAHLSSCCHHLTNCKHSSDKGCLQIGRILTLPLEMNCSTGHMAQDLLPHLCKGDEWLRKLSAIPWNLINREFIRKTLSRMVSQHSKILSPVGQLDLISPNWWQSPGLWRDWGTPNAPIDEDWTRNNQQTVKRPKANLSPVSPLWHQWEDPGEYGGSRGEAKAECLELEDSAWQGNPEVLSRVQMNGNLGICTLQVDREHHVPFPDQPYDQSHHFQREWSKGHTTNEIQVIYNQPPSICWLLD